MNLAKQISMNLKNFMYFFILGRNPTLSTPKKKFDASLRAVSLDRLLIRERQFFIGNNNLLYRSV